MMDSEQQIIQLLLGEEESPRCQRVQLSKSFSTENTKNNSTSNLSKYAAHEQTSPDKCSKALISSIGIRTEICLEQVLKVFCCSQTNRRAGPTKRGKKGKLTPGGKNPGPSNFRSSEHYSIPKIDSIEKIPRRDPVLTIPSLETSPIIEKRNRLKIRPGDTQNIFVTRENSQSIFSGFEHLSTSIDLLNCNDLL